MAMRSPGEIKMILHYHATRERWEPHTEWSRGVLHRLIEEGILEYQDGIPVSTPLGRAFVESICSTPVPVVAFIDPRTNERIDAD
jgi:hypothetical protein